MHAEIKKLLLWAVVGAVVGFVTVWLVSSSMPTGHRVTCGLMAAGGGLVVFAMIAANFTPHDETHDTSHDTSHGPSHH